MNNSENEIKKRIGEILESNQRKIRGSYSNMIFIPSESFNEVADSVYSILQQNMIEFAKSKVTEVEILDLVFRYKKEANPILREDTNVLLDFARWLFKEKTYEETFSKRKL